MTPNDSIEEVIRRLHEPPGEQVDSAKVPSRQDIRDLIPGADSVSLRVLFSEDCWDLAGHPGWRSKVGAQTKLDFTNVPIRWRSAVKEWVLLCLEPSLALIWAPDDPFATTWPQNQEPLKIGTAQSNLKALRLALQLLDLHNLIEPDVDGWARAALLMRQPANREDKLDHATLSPGTLRMRAQMLRSLWTTRTIVGRPTLLGDEPFGSHETAAIFGSGARPKLNRRRPHQDVGLCLGYIAWVFDNVADDIIARMRWWADNSLTAAQCPETREEGYQEMVDLLHRLDGSSGVLPGSRNIYGNVTLAHAALGRLLGQTDPDEAYLWGRFALRRFPDTPLDLHGGDPCPLPISCLPVTSGEGVYPLGIPASCDAGRTRLVGNSARLLRDVLRCRNVRATRPRSRLPPTWLRSYQYPKTAHRRRI